MPQITLMDLLAARDNRAAKERELLRQYPSSTLIVLTVVMPGHVKRNDDTEVIASEACAEIEKAFQNISYSELRDLNTGFEAYFICDDSPEKCKITACRIEDTHPLGRFFDIDIIVGDGTPLSRSQLKSKPRKCMLCENDARVCMRLGTHSYEEILHHIHTTVSQYVGR